MTHLTNVIEELRAEESRLRSDVDQLQAKTKAAESQLKQVRGALSALKEKPQSKSPNGKPAATRDDVVAVMIAILDEKGHLSEQDLKKLVEQQLASVGKSRTGFALRFKEALNDPRFARADTGVDLAAAHHLSSL